MEFIKRNTTTMITIIAVLLSVGFLVVIINVANQKTPEEIAYEAEIESINLDGLVEEFEVEGRDHVEPGTDVTEYQTNPPTSGTHWTDAQTWGVYEEEIPDGAAVHGLEHGGIWISYQTESVSPDTLGILRELQQENKGSVILSPRNENESPIVVASWGKMMELKEEELTKALVQKYINTYKNDSPEKLAR
jgi:hypothetical protein